MSLTASQARAVAARGNVLVMAGAGTGKTSTLVARCLDCLSGEDPASLGELLIVTFTEAAAAEARERIRAALEQKLAATSSEHWAHQLALFEVAHIGTLHSFCFQLVRQHFYQLGLDPQVSVLEEAQARVLAEETLSELLDDHYAGKLPDSSTVQQLIADFGSGRDESIRHLVRRLHAYSQTRPEAADWLRKQEQIFSSPDPRPWQEWLLRGIANWRATWLPDLEGMSEANSKARECAEIFATLADGFDRRQGAAMVERIVAAQVGPWPRNRKGELRKPLEALFAEAEFLATLAPAETDPLAEDWNWSREPMRALLSLALQFGERFQTRKRDDGVVDFHDLEQFALELLWDRTTQQPAGLAGHWRQKLRFIFVDEYQDINAAQDRILQALSREGDQANRFLVGDVKQSIYRFRLADPGIFREYARTWQNEPGQTITLAENFRSRPGILAFVNAVFSPLMRAEVGGVAYDAAARLIPGRPVEAVLAAESSTTSGAESGIKQDPPRPGPDVEILFRLTEKSAAGETEDSALEDLQSAEKEARHVALRLRAVKSSGMQLTDRETKQTRPVEWRDMAVLLRAPAAKADGYARQFERLGVPLEVSRGGFYESLEVADLLNLLRLLDNPLQDIPLLAVLRSPLVALSLDELATIRLAARGHFWTALVRWSTANDPSDESSLKSRVATFLDRFARWRALARQASLSTCLEEILAVTHYDDWLLAQERGAQRHAHVRRLQGLAEQFDQFQRQGLFRFLNFIQAQQEAGAEPEVAVTTVNNAVRLMSIHQSKGLEFPIVVVADLGKSFNRRDLSGEIVLDETYGVCPRVHPPGSATNYPSLAHWLAGQRQGTELLGEELRLLYVAMTRARKRLILTGSLTRKRWDELPPRWPRITPRALLSARCAADWLRLWLAQAGHSTNSLFEFRELNDAELSEAAATPVEAATAGPVPELETATLEKLKHRMDWNYPFQSATVRAAKTSVTALRRQAAEEDGEAEQWFGSGHPAGSWVKPTGMLDAAEIGVAHHKFLQHVALDCTGTGVSLRTEAERLRQERRLTDEEVSALDFLALERFWSSEVGVQIRAKTAHVRRELEFTARFAPTELDEILHRTVAPLADEFIVVQGVADLVVLLPEEIWLLDFKTDALTAGEVAGKAAFHAPQLQLYACALARIYARPVTRAWLHFLATGSTESMSMMNPINPASGAQV